MFKEPRRPITLRDDLKKRLKVAAVTNEQTLWYCLDEAVLDWLSKHEIVNKQDVKVDTAIV